MTAAALDTSFNLGISFSANGTAVPLLSEQICKIHPISLFTISDHYVRRNEGQKRANGILLGRLRDNVVEISATIPLARTDAELDVSDREYLATMFALHQKTRPKDSIVGWYTSSATSDDLHVDTTLASLHSGLEQWLPDSRSNPIFVLLAIDVSRLGGVEGSALTAYTQSSVAFANPEKKIITSKFQPIRVEVQSEKAEQSAINLIQKDEESVQNGDANSNLALELQSLEAVFDKISQHLELISQYVKKVSNGEVESNAEIGRLISNTITSLPKIDAKKYDKGLNNRVQDLLMIVYLSNLVRTQLAISEKLQVI
jgi:translation initiation factor 3 subunit F